MSNKIEIIASEEVAANTTVLKEIVPALKEFEIMSFTADSPIQDKTSVSVEYANVPIWTVWASEKMPFKIRKQGDGIKKLVMKLVNDEPSPVVISGHLVIRELGK